MRDVQKEIRKHLDAEDDAAVPTIRIVVNNALPNQTVMASIFFFESMNPQATPVHAMQVPLDLGRIHGPQASRPAQQDLLWVLRSDSDPDDDPVPLSRAIVEYVMGRDTARYESFLLSSS